MHLATVVAGASWFAVFSGLILLLAFLYIAVLHLAPRILVLAIRILRLSMGRKHSCIDHETSGVVILISEAHSEMQVKFSLELDSRGYFLLQS